MDKQSPESRAEHLYYELSDQAQAIIRKEDFVAVVAAQIRAALASQPEAQVALSEQSAPQLKCCCAPIHSEECPFRDVRSSSYRNLPWQQQLSLWIEAAQFSLVPPRHIRYERVVNADDLRAWLAENMELESMELRDEDRKVFVEALLNPPKPNEALKAALSRRPAPAQVCLTCGFSPEMCDCPVQELDEKHT